MSKVKLTPGDIFAVHTGTYAGEMLLYIDTDILCHNFLSLPNMVNRTVPKKSFELARNNDIIKYVERAPKYVITVSTAQFKQNEKSNNRREQPSTSHVLDG